MFRTLITAATAMSALLPCGIAQSEPVPGRVEALYVATAPSVLVELLPGMRAHDRPILASVRLRAADGTASREVMSPLNGETIQRGDIVAINEGEPRNPPRTAPPRSPDRLSHMQARQDSEFARNFFRTTPKFLALRTDD